MGTFNQTIDLPKWWSQAGSNRRPLACHASALPAELWPLNLRFSMISGQTLCACPEGKPDTAFPDHARRAPWAARGENPEHSSGPISSLFVATDVANNVGD